MRIARLSDRYTLSLDTGLVYNNVTGAWLSRDESRYVGSQFGFATYGNDELREGRPGGDFPVFSNPFDISKGGGGVFAPWNPFGGNPIFKDEAIPVDILGVTDQPVGVHGTRILEEGPMVITTRALAGSSGGGGGIDPFGDGTGGGTPVGPIPTLPLNQTGPYTYPSIPSIGTINDPVIVVSDPTTGGGIFDPRLGTGGGSTSGTTIPTFPNLPSGPDGTIPNRLRVYTRNIKKDDCSEEVYEITEELINGIWVERYRTLVAVAPPPPPQIRYAGEERVANADGSVTVYDVYEEVNPCSGQRSRRRTFKATVPASSGTPVPPIGGGGGTGTPPTGGGGGRTLVNQIRGPERTEPDDEAGWMRVVRDIINVYSDGSRETVGVELVRRYQVGTPAPPSRPVVGSSIYQRFDVENDIITDRTYIVTSGVWSDNARELGTFYTNSLQTSAQQQYYYEIYQSQSSACGAEPQFSIAFGHYAGSGSLSQGGQVNDTPSRAVYSQFRLLCLNPDDSKFTFKTGSATFDSDYIYVITFNRERIKDRLDAGNFELNLQPMSASVADPNSGVIVSLIDDSYDTDERFNVKGTISNIYNVVSGSIANGIHEATKNDAWGLVYPDLGVIILDGPKLDAQLSFGTELTSDTNGDNAYKMFLSISGSGAPNNARITTHPFIARNARVKTTSYLFARVHSGKFNFSNNPTWISGSEGRFAQPTFEGDPRVYITSIGLYNDAYELLAIGKLSQPKQKSFFNETLVKVKLNY